jgi:hypothetical protein
MLALPVELVPMFFLLRAMVERRENDLLNGIIRIRTGAYLQAVGPERVLLFRLREHSRIGGQFPVRGCRITRSH